MTRAAIALAVVLSSAPSAARADAIEGPPACPPGARGESSHSGQWCVPATCTSDTDCTEIGGHCRAYRVCTRRASIPPGGLGAFRDPPPPPSETEEVIGSCEAARACRGDEEPPPETAGTLSGVPTCVEATFCVPGALPSLPSAPAPSAAPPTAPSGPAPETAPTSASSCSCATPGTRAPLPSVLVVLALAIVIATRRRR